MKEQLLHAFEQDRFIGAESSTWYLSEAYAGESSLGLKEGSVLANRFKLIRALGLGNQGEVYEAHDEVSGESVALKIVEIGASRGDGLPSLYGELRANRAIGDHSNVVRIHEVYESDYGGTRLCILSMELAADGSLRHRLSNEACWDESTRLNVFRLVCLGVEAVHRAGLVHLDLKPENIVFVNGVPKVCDVGGTGDRLSSYTRRYAAPELSRDKSAAVLGEPADIYSLGIILSELMAVEIPSAGHRRTVHPSAAVSASQDPSVAEIIEKCTRDEPGERYASVCALREEIESCIPMPEKDLREEDIESRWQEALRAFADNRFAEAEIICQELAALKQPLHSAIEMLKEISHKRESASQIYATISRDVGHRDLGEILELLQEAVRQYPNHPNAYAVQTELLGKSRKFQHCINAGIRALQEHEWSLAAAHFQDAHQIAPSSPGAKRALFLAMEVKDTVTQSRGNIDRAISEGDREKALAYADALDNYVERIHAQVLDADLLAVNGQQESSL